MVRGLSSKGSKMSVQFSVSSALPKVARGSRSPKSPYNIVGYPFGITPFCCFPVLPGETLTGVFNQAKAITKPVKNSIIGWWLESYFFYVPVSALDDSAYASSVQESIINPDAPVTLDAGINSINYSYNGDAPHAYRAYRAVVRDYFRDEGESVGAVTVHNFYAARAQLGDTFRQSLMADTAITSADEELVVGADDKFTMSELDALQQKWMFARMNNLTDMTYEDWCRQFGVSLPENNLAKIELIGMGREWQYPANTVDASSGAVNSAVMFSMSDRFDKNRLFKQPGFVVGFYVLRPKVYCTGQQASAVGTMKDAWSWLPAALSGDQGVSLKRIASASGPVSNTGAAYVFDLRDLLLYGEQYINHTITTGYNGVALASFSKYATEAEADALFAAASPANSYNVDGQVRCTFKTSIYDHTPASVTDAVM